MSKSNITGAQTRKRWVNVDKESPFPVPVSSITEVPPAADRWHYYSGDLVGNCVIVHHKGDMDWLYHMGFFGKGNLSRSQPLYAKQRIFQTSSGLVEQPHVVTKKKYIRHMTWAKQAALRGGLGSADFKDPEELAFNVSKHRDKEDPDSEEVCVPENNKRHKRNDLQKQQYDYTNKTSEDWCKDINSPLPKLGLDKPTTSKRHSLKSADDSWAKEPKDPWGEESNDPWAKEPEDPWANQQADFDFWGTSPSEPQESNIPSTSHNRVLPEPLKTSERGKLSEDVKISQQSKTKESALESIQNSQSQNVKSEGSTLVSNKASTSEDIKFQSQPSSDDLGECHIEYPLEHTTASKELDHNSENIAETEVDPLSLEDENGGDLLVIDDSENENLQMEATWRMCIKEDPFPVREVLCLTLEEAFFLAYGLGCLKVYDSQKAALTLTEMWMMFSERAEGFIPNYITYHSLRSKGWVPKVGLKYGSEFVVYKEGPPFYHSSFCVRVSMVKALTLESDLDFPQRTQTWCGLSGFDRLTEHVAKDVLLYYVIRPEDLTDDDLKSPKCIPRFTVKEILLKRWVPTQERVK